MSLMDDVFDVQADLAELSPGTLEIFDRIEKQLWAYERRCEELEREVVELRSTLKVMKSI